MIDLLVQSKVRAYIKKQGLNTGGDALVALDKSFQGLLDNAVSRAKGNDSIAYTRHNKSYGFVIRLR